MGYRPVGPPIPGKSRNPGITRATASCGICLGPMERKGRRGRSAKYCSGACAREAARRKYRLANPYPYPGVVLPSGSVGAASELRVAVDLLMRGHSVFRALSPSSPCDLAVLCQGQLLRVEVRTKAQTPAGSVYKEAAVSGLRCDVLAVVINKGQQAEIRYLKPADQTQEFVFPPQET